MVARAACTPLAGRWVLTGNSSLCRYGDMARQVQAAGAAGLIVHANRQASARRRRRRRLRISTLQACS